MPGDTSGLLLFHFVPVPFTIEEPDTVVIVPVLYIMLHIQIYLEKGKSMYSVLILLISLLYHSFCTAIEVDYPDRAWHFNQNGYVKVVYDIDENGSVENIKILESKPAFMFDQAVKKALYKQRFEKNKPKKSVNLTVVFDKKDISNRNY
ncbi:TonB family protein [Arsenophonus apicola]|uniref:Protein TonB n=2 Tax=Arsenophonus TaxID=637 RepID=A0ABY8P022_9GAMM|nr:TonB family protein [Arsenophonus apicola]WGO82346.1 TonB family protein [Arsenophonus apicola]